MSLWTETKPPVTRAGAPSLERPIGLSSGALALFCSALWGGTVVAIRFSVDDLPPIATAGMRFLLAFILMFLWCRWQGSSLAIQRKQVVPILVTAVLLFLQISSLNIGAKYTSAAHGTILINAYPLFVALFSHALSKDDPLTPRKLIGLFVSVLGMALVVLGPWQGGWPSTAGEVSADATPSAAADEDRATLLGDLIIAGSALLLGLKTVYIKRVLTLVEPDKLLLWHELLAVLMFFAVSLGVEGVHAYHLTAPALLGVLYQGIVVAGFCFAAWTMLLQRHRASQVAAFSFTTPLFGVLASFLFRNERLTPALALGGVIVVGGIYLVTRDS